ncbi:hypothetical protein HUJ05_009534 [Dendroctonus ponderosae]|nr:hypothetical protein HUJ05_009534 [Dendroctonus ponderosae]
MTPGFYMPVKEEITIEEQDLSVLIKIEDEASSDPRSSENTSKQAAKAAEINQHNCNICSISFMNESKLNIHLKKCHADRGPFQCNICGLKYKQKRFLQIHQKRHTKNEQYTCQICATTLLISNLDDHLKTHSDTLLYECDFCDFKSKLKSDLTEHRNIHTKGNQHIYCVGMQPNFYMQVKEEIKIEEQDLSGLVKIEDEASSESTYEQAANAAQGGKITAEEEELPVLIKTEDELTSNLSSTQTTDPQAARTKLKKYKCNFCWAFFADKSNLDVHLARHSENHPFECDICGLKFKRIRQLTIHHNTHTKKRQFNCDICNKTFVLHSELFFHMKTHSDQRPYACDICSSKFKKRYQLVKHRNNHMILTEYTCSICDKTFVIERFYKDHLKTHSEEGPLQCDICNIQFKLKDTLLQHCRAVHSEPAI